MNKDEDILTCLGVITYIIVLFIVSSLMNGWALKTLWSWFVVPVFALPSLTIVQAIGISMIVQFLKSGRKSETSDDVSNMSWVEVMITGIAEAVLTPLISLALGWIVVQFM